MLTLTDMEEQQIGFVLLAFYFLFVIRTGNHFMSLICCRRRIIRQRWRAPLVFTAHLWSSGTASLSKMDMARTKSNTSLGLASSSVPLQGPWSWIHG